MTKAIYLEGAGIEQYAQALAREADAGVKAQARIAELKAENKRLFDALVEKHCEINALELALERIVDCTHRPNPTAPHQIDVAPGKHRAFQTAIETAISFIQETE
jgi:hypothetical protein